MRDSGRRLVENWDFIFLRWKQRIVMFFALGVAGALVFLPVLTLFFPRPRAVLGDLSRDGAEVVLPLLAAVVICLAFGWLWKGERRRLSALGFRIFPSTRGSPRRKDVAAEEQQAHWMSLYELLRYRSWKPGRLLFGRMTPEQRPLGMFRRFLIGSDLETNFLTTAPPGSGKGTSALIPNLIVYPGSALVIDPKGELANITAGRRGHGATTLGGSRVTKTLGQDVFIVDPGNKNVFTVKGVSRGTTARYNPLAELAGKDQSFVEDVVESLTAILVPKSTGSEAPFWSESARSWLKAVMLHVLSSEEPENHHLPLVRRFALSGDEESQKILREKGAPGEMTAFEALLARMKDNPAHGGEVAREAREMEGYSRTEMGMGIIKTLNTKLTWIGTSEMSHVLSGNDFTLADLRKKPTTIYICMTQSDLTSTNARLLLNMILLLANKVMEREKAIIPRKRILYVVDEFTNIGFMEPFVAAFNYLRGFHVSIWAVIQDIDQMRLHYKDSLNVILASCDIVQVMGAGNDDTADWASRLFSGLMSKEDIRHTHKEERKQWVRFSEKRTHMALLEQVPYYEWYPKSHYDPDPGNELTSPSPLRSFRNWLAANALFVTAILALGVVFIAVLNR